MPFTIVALRVNEIHTTTDKCGGIHFINYNVQSSADGLSKKVYYASDKKSCACKIFVFMRFRL